MEKLSTSFWGEQRLSGGKRRDFILSGERVLSREVKVSEGYSREVFLVVLLDWEREVAL